MQGLKNLLFITVPLCFALLLVIGLGEVAIRFISSHRLIYNVEMVKYAKGLKTRDPEGLNSHIHRANASARLMGVDVSLNSWGHRGKEPALQTSGLTRVLVLGSSVTMGWGVPEDKVFTSVVEDRLNREKPFGARTAFEFDNAGIGNYDTLAQLNLLKRQHEKLKPDAVILHYFINDAEPRTTENNSALMKHSYWAAYLYGRVRAALQLARKTDLTSHYAALYRDEDGAWSQTRQYVGKMSAITRKNDIPFIVMIIPDIHNLRPGTPYADIYAKIDRDFTAMGLQTINTFGEFQERFGEDAKALWIQADDPHPNEKGHALMAELLYRYLLARNPLRLQRKNYPPRAV